MLSLYLFSLIVGGGLLLFSVLGSHADGADGLHGDHGIHHLDGGTMAHEFFSVRSLSHFLAGFGATGTLLALVAGAGPLATALWSLGSGAGVAALAALAYGWLRRTESGLVETTPDYLVGLPAQVLLPVTRERQGKVVAVHQGREVQLLARLHAMGDADCPRGSTVVIVDLAGDTALVTPANFLPSEAS